MQIDINPTKTEDNEIYQILLLGSGCVGKSTIFKASQLLYNSASEEKVVHDLDGLPVIRQNCMYGLLTLLKKSQELYDMNPIKYRDCLIDLGINAQLIPDIQLLVTYGSETFTVLEDIDYNEVKELGLAMNRLWRLKQVQSVFRWRYHGLYSFIQNFDYFMNKIEYIMLEDYEINDEDRLKLRVRTTGHVSRNFVADNYQFALHDTGGERNERKKWIHHFGNKDAVIYVCALDQYCQALFEDEKKNALIENLELWQEIGRSKWFTKTPIFVILNKTDLFKESLKHQPLNFCFGEEYKGKNYKDLHKPLNPIFNDYLIQRIVLELLDPNLKNVNIATDIYGLIRLFWNYKVDDYWVYKVYEDGVAFIKNKFLQIRSNIRIYELCAVNTEEVDEMMRDIQQHIFECKNVF